MISYENQPGTALGRNSLPCISDPSIRGSPDRFFALVPPATKIPSQVTSPNSRDPLAEGFSKGFSRISPEMSTPVTPSSSFSSANAPIRVNTSVPAKISLPSISSLPTITLGSDKIGNYGIMPITAPVMADSELPPNLARARLSSAQDVHPADSVSAPIPWEAHVSDTATLEPPHLPVRHKSITPRGSSINSILGVSKRRKHGVLTTKNAVPEPLIVHGSHSPHQTDAVQFQMQPQIQQPQHKLHAHDHALPSIDQSVSSSRKSSNNIPELESSRWSESSGSSSLYASPLASPAGSQGRSPEYQPNSEDASYTTPSMQHSLKPPTTHSRRNMYELNPSHLMVPRSHYEPMMQQHIQQPVQPLQHPPQEHVPRSLLLGHLQ